jgi:hypothetical protein
MPVDPTPSRNRRQRSGVLCRYLSHHILACPRLAPNMGKAKEGERGTIRLRMVSPIWSVVAEISGSGSRPCRRLTTLMRPSHPVRHFWPSRNQRFFCSRLRSGLLVERLGMQTRLTPQQPAWNVGSVDQSVKAQPISSLPPRVGSAIGICFATAHSVGRTVDRCSIPAADVRDGFGASEPNATSLPRV